MLAPVPSLTVITGVYVPTVVGVPDRTPALFSVNPVGNVPAVVRNVKFPAPVVVNGVTLPAGDTSIQVIHNNGGLMLTIRAESGEHSTVLVTRSESNEDGSEAKVVFDEKDGIYHLNRVVLPNHTSLQVLDQQ